VAQKAAEVEVAVKRAEALIGTQLKASGSLIEGAAYLVIDMHSIAKATNPCSNRRRSFFRGRGDRFATGIERSGALPCQKTQFTETLDQRIHIRVEQRNTCGIGPDRSVGRVS